MTRPVPENPDLSQAERIDQVCTAFEAAWKTGAAPRLEDWLDDLAGADRLALLQELLLVEVHYRPQCGPAEYRRRFPELEESWLKDRIPPAEETVAHNGNATPGSAAGTAEAAPATIRFAGDYELQEEIGRGGMGVVYRGHDADLNRMLAVKVLLEKHTDNEELKRRFLEEAQIMGQLQHPGVAPIHEIGALQDGRPFFSMKQIKGQTLTELLLELPDLPRLLSIFEQVCQTMAAAHSRGIIHRDLKPGNVMVGAFGEVQVMDWGLAKVLRQKHFRSLEDFGSVDRNPYLPVSTFFELKG
jgi:serine/threonine protein kinase